MLDVMDDFGVVSIGVFIGDNPGSSENSEMCHIEDGKVIDAFHDESSSIGVRISWHHDDIYFKKIEYTDKKGVDVFTFYIFRFRCSKDHHLQICFGGFQSA